MFEPLQEHMLNRPVRFFRQFLDPQNLTAVHTPEPFWRGRIVDVDIDLQQGVYEIRAADDRRTTAKVAYFNRETFREVDSSDTFGDWIDSVPLFKGNWGGSTVEFSGGRVIKYYAGRGAARPQRPDG
jgi:hypothetical protein